MAGKTVSGWAHAVGAMLCLFCAFAYSTNGFLAKLLMTRDAASPYFVAFSRQFFMVAFIVPIAAHSRVRLVGSPQLNSHWKAMVVRCLFGAGALVYYLALYFASLADVGVIFTATIPIFSSIFARIFLKEPFRYSDSLFMLATAIGVALILRPPFLFPAEQANEDGTSLRNRLLGGGCSLLSAFLQSIAFIGARSCTKAGIHYSVLVFWNCLTGLVVSFTLMVILEGYQSPCDFLNRFLVVLASVCAMLGQVATTLSIHYIGSVVTSLSTSAELAFLFVYQTTLLGQPPHLFSIVGSAIIVVAMLVLVLRSWLIDNMKQAENDDANKKGDSVFAPTSKHRCLFEILTK